MRQISLAACLLAILASFVLSFTTWLDLGTLAGYASLAVALPFCVDGYVVCALTTWLLPGSSDRLARLARLNLYGVGLASVLAQASYHGWLVGSASPGKALLAVVVGALPPAVAVLAVHLRARDVREVSEAATPPATPQRSPEPMQSPPPAARPEVAMPVVTASSQPQVRAVVAAPVAPAVSRPRHKVDASGSGPRTKSASVDDVRKLVKAGLGRNAIAERLGIGTGAARTLIERVKAEDAGLRVVS